MVMPIPYLEMPITHLCSLHCDGCSAYSNYNLKRTVPLTEARQWLKQWSVRIAPAHFRILGGEPLLHPNLPEILLSARQFWPATHIQVCTNGLNLDRHPTLPFLLALPNMSLSLSVHSRDEAYLAKINVAIATINCWVADFGVTAQLGDNIAKWNRFYKGIGKSHAAVRRRCPGELESMPFATLLQPDRQPAVEMPADRQPACGRREVLSA